MKFKPAVFIVLLVTVLFAACQKEDTPLVQPLTTQLSTVNATTDALNIFQFNSRLNNLGTLSPGGVSGYLNVVAGAQDYQFKRNGSAEVLFTNRLTLDSTKKYSFFIAGLAAEDQFLVDDSFTTDTGNRALVRFVNASPEISTLELLVTDIIAEPEEGDPEPPAPVTVKFSDRAYKSVSDFLPVVATTGSKELKLRVSGSATALITDTVTLQSGGVYTIFTRGKIGQTGNAAFARGMISNQ